jgi:hypothetical protein
MVFLKFQITVIIFVISILVFEIQKNNINYIIGLVYFPTTG